MPKAPTPAGPEEGASTDALRTGRSPCLAGYSKGSFSLCDWSRSSLQGKFGNCHMGPTIDCHQRLRNFPGTYERTYMNGSTPFLGQILRKKFFFFSFLKYLRLLNPHSHPRGVCVSVSGPGAGAFLPRLWSRGLGYVGDLGVALRAFPIVARVVQGWQAMSFSPHCCSFLPLSCTTGRLGCRPVRGAVELSGMTAFAFSSCWQTDQTHRSLREETSYPMPDCLLTVQEAVWLQVHWKYTDLQAKPPLPEGKGTVEHLAPPSRPGPCCSQEG